MKSKNERQEMIVKLIKENTISTVSLPVSNKTIVLDEKNN